MSMKTTFDIDDVMSALQYVGDVERADNLVAELLGISLDELWEFEEEWSKD